MKKTLAPVLLFVYARPNHTKKMIESLSKNKLAKESEVWIFSDNAKKDSAKENVRQVREYIHSIENKGYFKKVHIIEAQKNKGLANSVIDGVTEIINELGKAIILEDDLVVTNNFLDYMNEALDFYEKDERIWSISGYNFSMDIPEKYKHDIFLSYRGCSWGWATWKEQWNTVDWNVEDYNKFKNSYKKRKHFNKGGNDLSLMLDRQMRKEIDSWAIRWCYSQSKQNKYTIYPVNSLVCNIGLDGSGTHSGNIRDYDVTINDTNTYKLENVEENKEILEIFKRKYNYGLKQKIREIFSILNIYGIIKKYDKIKGNR